MPLRWDYLSAGGMNTMEISAADAELNTKST